MSLGSKFAAEFIFVFRGVVRRRARRLKPTHANTIQSSAPGERICAGRHAIYPPPRRPSSVRQETPRSALGQLWRLRKPFWKRWQAVHLEAAHPRLRPEPHASLKIVGNEALTVAVLRDRRGRVASEKIVKIRICADDKAVHRGVADTLARLASFQSRRTRRDIRKRRQVVQ